jgi:hypothetical protein
MAEIYSAVTALSVTPCTQYSKEETAKITITGTPLNNLNKIFVMLQPHCSEGKGLVLDDFHLIKIC